MHSVMQQSMVLTPCDRPCRVRRVPARESRNRPGREVAFQLPAEAPLVGDEEILERAFENLIRNALEAAGPGGHVTVGASSEAASGLVNIEDGGPGLPRDALNVLRTSSTAYP